MNTTKLAQKLGVTPAQISIARGEILSVWNMIGDDYTSCFEGGYREACRVHGGENPMIAEAVIDADRLRSYGESDAHWVYDHPSPIRVALDILNAR
jgi:hypothetical protein